MNSVTYSEVVSLAEQLSPLEQIELAAHLRHIASQRKLSKEEKLTLLKTKINHRAFKEEPSIRREDWYDDDGR